MTNESGVAGLRSKEWVRPSSSILEDLHALEEAVSDVGFEHGISNWQLIFIADPDRKKRVLSSCETIHADVLAVFCVDPDAWSKPHPDLWEYAGFEERARYIDDMFAIGRGNKTLQRDRAMRSVGMAAGAMVSKAKSLGYSVDNIDGVDLSLLEQEMALPASHQIEYVFAIGHQTNHSPVGKKACFDKSFVARERFSQRLAD